MASQKEAPVDPRQAELGAAATPSAAPTEPTPAPAPTQATQAPTPAPRDGGNGSSTKLVTTKQKMAEFQQRLDKRRDNFVQLLPKHISVDYFKRTVMIAAAQNDKLLECAPDTVILAVMKAAQFGLPPDGLTGFGYLIPFFNKRAQRMECQFIPGYQGLMDVARRSGQIVTIEAVVVHANDQFDYCRGSAPLLKHKPYMGEGSPGGMIAVYAIAFLKGGASQFEVLRYEDVEDVRKGSMNGEGAIWRDHYEAMARKTALRALCKMLPKSIEIAGLIASDERAERGMTQDLDIVVDADGVVLDSTSAN